MQWRLYERIYSMGNILKRLWGFKEFYLPPKGKGLSHRARAFVMLADACLR